MEQIKTYEIAASPALLREAFAGGMLPDNLLAPLQALAGDIVARAQRAPLSIYLCSTDDDREARNYFGALLAKTLQYQLPDMLLVDCDFLSVGLDGIVPQHDSLGFLDMLLYGSSLGVIKQTATGGVNVIGAGSFPVSRKSPFVMDVFVSASRYLASHSKCVIYCGPVLDDEQEVHPILEQVDVPVLLRVGGHAPAGGLDALEDRISRERQATLWGVRLIAGDVSVPAQPGTERPAPAGPSPTGRAPTGPAATGPTPAEPPVPPGQPEPELDDTIVLTPVDEVDERPVYDQVPVYEAPAPGEPSAPPAAQPPPGVFSGGATPASKGQGTSAFPKIVLTILAILLPAFFLWWLYQTKSVREQNGEPQEITETTRQPQSTPQTPPPVPQPRDTAVSAADTSRMVASQTTPKTPAPAETDVAPPPEEKENLASSILVTENIHDFAGKFLVHVSSFRNLQHARGDAYYLNDRGYPVVIANVDLGAKGNWYRVYVGPCDRRSEARNLKIRLDEVPRVKFTRITKVEG